MVSTGQMSIRRDMTGKMNIAIAGVAGRMGRQLVETALDLNHQVSGGSEAPGSVHLGRDIGELAGLKPIGRPAYAGIGEAANGADVWVDFTVPKATLAALDVVPGSGAKAMVIGTTGFSAAEDARIVEASERLAIVRAGNFSLGVNLLEALVQQAAARLGDDWDIEVLETHHRRKMDAPSGTALMLGDAAARGRGEDLARLRSAPYDGPEAKREAGKIGFSVRRSGGVIGEHDVTFASDMEILSLSHTALDRAVFAHGAIKAAEWAVRQAPGLYGMSDVLGV